jgi:hypothetical protein
MKAAARRRPAQEVPDGPEGAELMRCDLHVHSWYSGRAEVPVLEHVGRECYSDPADVYERALERGRDVVTLADHDTIDGEGRRAAEIAGQLDGPRGGPRASPRAASVAPSTRLSP